MTEVPLTTTTPRGSPPSVDRRNPGSIRSATSPGSADPPLPLPRSREAVRASLPAAIAAVVLNTSVTLPSGPGPRPYAEPPAARRRD